MTGVTQSGELNSIHMKHRLIRKIFQPNTRQYYEIIPAVQRVCLNYICNLSQVDNFRVECNACFTERVCMQSVTGKLGNKWRRESRNVTRCQNRSTFTCSRTVNRQPQVWCLHISVTEWFRCHLMVDYQEPTYRIPPHATTIHTSKVTPLRKMFLFLPKTCFYFQQAFQKVSVPPPQEELLRSLLAKSWFLPHIIWEKEQYDDLHIYVDGTNRLNDVHQLCQL